MIKKILSVRHYKAGYEIREQLIDGSEFNMDDFVMKVAYTPEGWYIGDTKTAYRLCHKRGIKPEIAPVPNGCACGDRTVCTIGFSDKEQKWYGWSHRAICGFGIGDKVTSSNHLCAQSGWSDEFLEDNPTCDVRLPVGFIANTLDDAKLMAISMAEAVG
jgi:hypothetical protein